MFEGLKRLYGSRKNWSMDKALIIAVLSQALTVWALTHGWAPEKMNGAISDAGNIITLVAALGNAWVALLTAMEDGARKWGVTTPPPGEGAAAPLPMSASSPHGEVG